MAEQLTLDVQKRSITNKGAVRRLRNESMVPGIFYNAAGENIPIQVKEPQLNKLYSKTGYTRVFQLQLEDDGQARILPSIVWDLKYHPVKNQVIHVDFYGVDPDKELRLEILIKLTGTPKGVKLEGGVLDLYRDFIEVICLPSNIPDEIVLDVTNLALNDMIHITDITLPEGVRTVFDDDYAVVGVHLPEEQSIESKEEEAEQAEEAAQANEPQQ